MANYLDNGLLAMIKSLRDVVLPSVDPNDPLAREQLSLAVDYLEFLRGRLDFVVPQVRFELGYYIAMARDVLRIAGDGPASRELAASVAGAVATESDPAASLDRLRTASQSVATAIGLVVTSVCDAEPALRSAVERVVLESSASWIDFERSWYLPISVDPEAAALPPFWKSFPSESTSCAKEFV